MQPNACTVQQIKGDMTSSGRDKGESTESPQRTRRRNPDPLDALYPALQVGGLLGMCSSSPLPRDRYLAAGT